MEKKIFICSSSKAKEQARKIAEWVEEFGAQATTWFNLETFVPGENTLDDLLRNAHNHSGGIFVLAEDDILVLEDTKQFTARDNVLIEAGIYYGALGKESVALCVVGKVKIPSDWLGITTILYDNENITKRRISVWLQHVEPCLFKQPCNVLMQSRYENHELYTIDDRMQISSKNYKYIRSIRLLNFAGTQFFNPQYGVNDVRTIRLADAIRTVMEHGNATFEVILTKPTDSNLNDLRTKISNFRIGAEGAIFGTFYALNELVNKEGLYKTLCESKRFLYFTTNISIPYSIFNVEYHKNYSYLNHVNIDLYSAQLTGEDERRSMIIWQAKDKENYKFFVDNYCNIRNNCAEVPSTQELAQWADMWVSKKELAY